MIAPLGILTGSVKIKAVIATAIAVSMWGQAPELGSDPIMFSPSAHVLSASASVTHTTIDTLHDENLWRYLREGLNYLEASGREVPVDFVHPGGVAFGPLALTRIAVKDVLLRCKAMAGYTINDVLEDRVLYEECARLYADLLLRHYLKVDADVISRQTVFEILQKAWFLGPTIYKKGGESPQSRVRKAREYINRGVYPQAT